MVFRIRRRKTTEPELRSIEDTSPVKAIVVPVVSPRLSAKAAQQDEVPQNAAQPQKAGSSIRSMFKKTNKKKKGKQGRKFILQLDSLSLRSKFSSRSEDIGSSSSPPDPRGKRTQSGNKPPLPPGVQHIRYRNAYTLPPTDEQSARSSVVSDDSIYKLMMKELKQDFSSGKHAPLTFVPAQTVVRSNKTQSGKEYQEALDKTLRVLDEEPGLNQQVESRDSQSQRSLNEEIREGSPSAVGENDENINTVGPLRNASQEDRQAFEAQLDCASDDALTGDASVAGRSVRSSRSARSHVSTRSGRSALSNRSNRSGRSMPESELVSLRDLRGKRRHRRRGSDADSTAHSYSDDSSQSTGGQEQSLRKLSTRDRRRRVPADSRSYYSEATGTFDDTTLGDTEYEWDNIDSFDSWLSVENELRNGSKNDWFCGACFR